MKLSKTQRRCLWDASHGGVSLLGGRWCADGAICSYNSETIKKLVDGGYLVLRGRKMVATEKALHP